MFPECCQASSCPLQLFSDDRLNRGLFGVNSLKLMPRGIVSKAPLV